MVLILGNGEGNLRLWDVSGKEFATLERRHTSRVTGVAVHPDGKTFATSSLDRTVKVWEVPAAR